jgi:hypothetical protein
MTAAKEAALGLLLALGGYLGVVNREMKNSQTSMMFYAVMMCLMIIGVLLVFHALFRKPKIRKPKP